MVLSGWSAEAEEEEKEQEDIPLSAPAEDGTEGSAPDEDDAWLSAGGTTLKLGTFEMICYPRGTILIFGNWPAGNIKKREFPFY